MRVSVFGIGYVGAVSAAALAKAGHEVLACDVSDLKVGLIMEGKSPVVEPGLEELITEQVRTGRLRATTSPAEAIASSDLSLICVGTPSLPSGALDLTYVKRVSQQIGEALASHGREGHTIVMRSTMLPGTCHETLIPILEVYSGKRHGRDFHLAVNPEFLREGSSLADYEHPPFTLIGTDSEEAASRLRILYSTIDAPVHVCGIREAEMVKYACNAFHATKIVFANELGSLCKQLGINSHRVMEIFVTDGKLNLSPYYLRPGFAYGGSCLPKDVRAITYKAKTVDVEVPLLDALNASNRKVIDRVLQRVLQHGSRKIGIVGLSFKTGTDDLRESPTVTLVEMLLGKGMQLAIYDRDVQLGRLHGANKEYIERGIPHISSLLRDSIDEVVAHAEILVVAKSSGEVRQVASRIPKETLVLDLVRIVELEKQAARYEGLCW